MRVELSSDLISFFYGHQNLPRRSRTPVFRGALGVTCSEKPTQQTWQEFPGTENKQSEGRDRVDSAVGRDTRDTDLDTMS